MKTSTRPSTKTFIVAGLKLTMVTIRKTKAYRKSERSLRRFIAYRERVKEITAKSKSAPYRGKMALV